LSLVVEWEKSSLLVADSGGATGVWAYGYTEIGERHPQWWLYGGNMSTEQWWMGRLVHISIFLFDFWF
jgi:hypothetical protein